MIPEGWQEILVTDAVFGPRSCVVPNTLVEELKKLKAFKEMNTKNDSLSPSEQFLELACFMADESQIVSGCRDDYERGRYEALRQALDYSEKLK